MPDVLSRRNPKPSPSDHDLPWLCQAMVPSSSQLIVIVQCGTKRLFWTFLCHPPAVVPTNKNLWRFQHYYWRTLLIVPDMKWSKLSSDFPLVCSSSHKLHNVLNRRLRDYYGCFVTAGESSHTGWAQLPLRPERNLILTFICIGTADRQKTSSVCTQLTASPRWDTMCWYPGQHHHNGCCFIEVVHRRTLCSDKPRVDVVWPVETCHVQQLMSSINDNYSHVALF